MVWEFLFGKGVLGWSRFSVGGGAITGVYFFIPI